MTRAAMWLLLAVVASAAAVLSFASLRDLALLCGFAPELAPLLPVVIDAGAAAGCLVWLGSAPSSSDAEEEGAAARRVGDQAAERTLVSYARTLTLALLVASVAGNALVHYLGTYGLRPAWWLVVTVSAVAPAVLGAVVHLAVLTAQGRSGGAVVHAEPLDDPARYAETPDVGGTQSADRAPDPVAELIESGAGRRRLARELGVSEHTARQLIAERNGVPR